MHWKQIDLEKYDMIASSQNVDNTNLDTAYFLVSRGRKRKQMSFQKRCGLQGYKWLYYGLGRMVFTLYFVLTDDENANLHGLLCMCTLQELQQTQRINGEACQTCLS